MKFENKIEMYGNREVQYLQSPTFEGKKVFKDVATNNIVVIPENIADIDGANIWYAGYGPFNEGKVNASNGPEGYPLIAHINATKEVMILSGRYAGNHNISYESNWDAIIEDNNAILSNIENTVGQSIDNVNTMGLSYGEALAMRTFADSDKKGICCIMGASNNWGDPSNGNYGNTWYGDLGSRPPKASGLQPSGHKIDFDPCRAYMTNAEYQNCVGRKFFIFESGAGGDYTYVKTLVEKGADVYWFDVYLNPETGTTGDRTAHADAFTRALDKGLYAALSGDDEAIKELYDAFKPKKVKDVTVEDQNYEWAEISLEEFRNIILSELDNSVQLTQLKINEGLKNALSAAGEDTLLTTLETVAHRMNNIRGIVDAYTEVPNGGFHSTAPKKLADYINKYAGMYSIYASKISAETAGILSNAEGIVAMDEDLDDLVARQLSDDYHGTNLASEAGISTPSEGTSVDATTNIPTKEGSGIDYSSLNASQLKADTAERITNDLKYHDEQGNVLETPRDDTEVLLKFLEKEGYDLPSSITIKNILTTDACAEYCNEKGYSNPTENGLYAQLEFVIRESDSLSQIKNIKSDTLSHTMRAKTYNLGKNIFEKDEKYMSDLWIETLYNQCMADYKEK